MKNLSPRKFSLQVKKLCNQKPNPEVSERLSYKSYDTFDLSRSQHLSEFDFLDSHAPCIPQNAKKNSLKS